MTTSIHSLQDIDESIDEDYEPDVDTFESLFAAFTEKWMETQVTHHVSVSAANAFWILSLQYVHDLYRLKVSENIRKGIPQFVHLRRQIQKDICPEVNMSFAFMNKNDGNMHYVQHDQTPLKDYQRDPQYKKMYEEAHIQVYTY